VRGGDIEATAESDVILVTASVPKRDIEISRREYLGVNLPLVLDTIKPMIALSPTALWMIASSPVDPLVYLVREVFSLSKEKVIGLNRNDTSRFRWALGRTLGVAPATIEAFVLGEHGETQVPVFSNIKIDGEQVVLTAEQVSGVRAEMDGFFVKWNQLQAGRTAGWTSAESVGDVISSMVSEGGRVWPCSSILDGEYGLRDVSLGVPVILAGGKVREIVKLALSGAEERALETSAASIREMISDGRAILARSRN
jgi:malate dehydrogenase